MIQGIVHLPNIAMILMLYDTDIGNWECQPSMSVRSFIAMIFIHYDICSIQLMLHDTDIDGYIPHAVIGSSYFIAMILNTWYRALVL